MRLEAIIFDFDGVLLDSERAHWELYQQVLAPLGAGFSWEEYAERWMALHDAGCIEAVLAERRLPAGEERVEALVEQKARRFAARIGEGRLPLFAGARELAQALAGRYRLAICSGALRAEIEAVLAAHGLRALFGPIIAAEDTRRHKPDPEPYERAFEALARLREGSPQGPLERGRCLAFEDTPEGIAAAKAAGLRCVGVAHFHPSERLGAADAVVETLVGLDAAGALDALLGG